ncbi:LOW QUALITY PROTEIN: cyclin-U2-1-like [Dioscorea cayenensis subsp. rotundata]|uniref:LOW QUALITY PROTEIN: cyclin-U2-1-like n=1 Tax=Dioscorea cayennensis subsp. rotundata TaxID=55577 RepID=A0AB40CUK8_DIOCR|nr:LOW QUALITY PROTEIN: cyclin-U2-1-like [Dioscorea cayenensis subsp. rotundata]
MYLIITHSTPPTPPSSPYLSSSTFIHSFINSLIILTMPSSSSSSSSSMMISPTKLRSDLYSLPESEETPSVISVLASLVERVIARNERINGGECSSRFGIGNERVLDMSVKCFMERIFRYAKVAPPVYVVAYVYMDRLANFNPEFRISYANVHPLLITAIMVASKFVEDLNYRNSYFAKVGGLTTEEMNRLEIDFLFMMRFKLHVNVSVYESYCMHLEREVSIGGGYQIERTLRFMLMCSHDEDNVSSFSSSSSKYKYIRKSTTNVPFNQQHLAKVL